MLLNNVDEAGLKLDLAQNEFQNLKNTQFIESRVYDDDETLDSKEEEKVCVTKSYIFYYTTDLCLVNRKRHS